MMHALPKIDMKSVSRLTREGRLRDAMALLRDGFLGSSDSAAKKDWFAPPNVARSTDKSPQKPFFDDESFKRPFDPATTPTALRGVFEKLGIMGDTAAEARAFAPRRKSVNPNTTHPGRFIEKRFSNLAGARDYKLYIPSTYTGAPVPLVVMLHGCTQSPDDFAVGTGMNRLAEEQTFLVAYPRQPRAANAQKCWNWFNAADQQRDRGEPSLIAGITREIMRDYAVAPERVYVAGLSAGGAAAAIMGEVYPDLFAAVGVHSGLACGAASDMTTAFSAMRRGGKVKAAPSGGALETRTPTIIFHGDRDATVHPVNAEQVSAQAGSAGLRKAVEQGVAPGGLNYTRIIYSDSAQKPIVEKWELHGVAHAWSGGNDAGTYTEPRGPDASREMLRFFAQHARPAATNVALKL